MRLPFFPVALNLVGRRCIVIGAADDREATEKSMALAECGAGVVRITDVAALRDEQLDGAFLVISTPQDAVLSMRLRALADARGFLLCCIDQPDYGFVAMMATAKAGPVRAAISTAGLAPRLGKVIKEALQRAMDEKFAAFVAVQAEAREASRSLATREARREAMLEAARGFEAEVHFSYPPRFHDDA